MTIDETALIMNAFVAIGTIVLACATFYSIKNLKDQYRNNHIRELLSETVIILNNYLYFYKEQNNNIQLIKQTIKDNPINKQGILKNLLSTNERLIDRSEEIFREFSRIEIMLEYSNVPDKEFKEMIKEFNNCYDDFKELDFKKSISNLKDCIKFIEDPIYIAWLDSINNLINTCVRLKQTKYC
ncbi:hypothetical protein [Dehalococcoides mccartyi]|uniref:Conserved domain protein n=1 Tax=Dehalococcoides mccartyi (strain ATCC BAA-2266 / KCTC 15142 / 195) TaxID=243164 RepID=Q3Z845_DEHM1|nr:hypothetical protein [Dehalococcoides mccartyi]AAW39842.1 conserved domain protein [Dehalococcoides mccartyi 195]